MNSPSFDEYRTLRAQGQIRAGIDQSTALRCIYLLPNKYQNAHNFWSWIWMFSIPFFVIAAFFTSGLALLGLFIITPLIFSSTKKSAVQFVLEELDRNESLYYSLAGSGAITFQRSAITPPPLPRVVKATPRPRVTHLP